MFLWARFTLELRRSWNRRQAKILLFLEPLFSRWVVHWRFHHSRAWLGHRRTSSRRSFPSWGSVSMVMPRTKNVATRGQSMARVVWSSTPHRSTIIRCRRRSLEPTSIAIQDKVEGREEDWVVLMWLEMSCRNHTRWRKWVLAYIPFIRDACGRGRIRAAENKLISTALVNVLLPLI